jgi:hypothetical protein
MAQIIDIEERRKPRPAPRGKAEPPAEPSALDPFAYLGQLAVPLVAIWRSWFATWGSLWLAPFGLQVSPVENPPPLAPKDRMGPRG